MITPDTYTSPIPQPLGPSPDVMRQWSENDLRKLMAEMILDWHKATSHLRYDYSGDGHMQTPHL